MIRYLIIFIDNCIWVVSNDGLNNLSSEWDDDYAKLQHANDTQLITIFAIIENKMNYSLTIAEQKKKKQRIV